MAACVMERLKSLVAEELTENLTVDEIDENVALFGEGLGLDSVEIFRLIALLEQHFGIQFAETDLTLEHFRTLRDVAALIASKGE